MWPGPLSWSGRITKLGTNIQNVVTREHLTNLKIRLHRWTGSPEVPLLNGSHVEIIEPI